MDNKPTILVIEDEPPLQKFLRVILNANGYLVIEAADGNSGIRHAANDRPDLIILDLGLPDIDGLTVLQQIREWSTLPIIVVSARGKEMDKVTALDGGANDYLTKPFHVGELLARVRVCLRSIVKNESATSTAVFELGKLRIDFARREVTVESQQIHLTPNEFRLLTALVKHAGCVLTHRQLLKEVWGPGSGDETHYLRVYMNQLRRKIEADPGNPRYLLTEVGVGYRLKDE